MTNNKIVQIIPGDGWMARFPDRKMRVVAFGLREDGTVVPLIASDDGNIVDASASSTFQAVFYSGHINLSNS